MNLDAVLRTYNTRSDLTDFETRHKVIAEARKFFRSRGWNIDKPLSGEPYDTAHLFRKKGHHTKIHLSVSKYYVQGEVWIKTPQGGWTNYGHLNKGFEHHNVDTSDLNKTVDRCEALVPAKAISKTQLPEPLKFGEPAIVIGDPKEHYNSGDKTIWVHRKIEVGSARVTGLYGLEDDGALSAQKKYEPNEDIWFHIDCSSPTGATFDLLADLECENVYPVRRSGKKRITTNTQPKTTVNLKQLSKTDRETLKTAIDSYMGLVVT